MGFSIIIGEGIKDGKRLCAAETERADAPVNPSGEGRSNHWQPSYTGMHDFSNGLSGLSEMFEEILKSHPGCVKIKKRYLVEVQIAIRSRWKLLQEQDQMRLKFLEFWLDWALKNCKKPVISNS